VNIMVAVIVSGFKHWNAQYRRQTLGVLFLSVTVFGCFTGLRPEMLFSGIALAFIWLGLRTGDQSGGEVEVENWLTKAGLSPFRIICGKMLAALMVDLLHFFLILPVMVLMTMLWGVGWWIVAELNLLILIFTLLVTSFSMFFRPTEYANLVVNAIFISGLLLITYVAPHLKHINPFYPIWNIAASGADKSIWTCFFVNFGLLLFMMGVWFLNMTREVKRYHERRSGL
jgi:hypothetical protein